MPASILRVVANFLHNAHVIVRRAAEPLRVDGVVDVIEETCFSCSTQVVFVKVYSSFCPRSELFPPECENRIAYPGNVVNPVAGFWGMAF